MPTHPFIRCLPFCFALLFLLSVSAPLCRADGKDKNTQFNSGQTGTPNLPAAVSRWVNQTHFGGASQSVSFRVMASNNRQRLFIISAYLLSHQDVPDSDAISLLFANEQQAEVAEQASNYYPLSYLYVGTDARLGSGRPIYALPELSYGDTRSGIELGAESFYEFGNENDPGQDSVGVSLKVELTNVSRGYAQSVHRIQKAQAERDNPQIAPTLIRGKFGSDFEKLFALAGDKTHAPDINGIRKLTDSYSFLLPSNNRSEIATGADYLKAVKKLNDAATNLLQDYVRVARHPSISVIVGDRFVNDGGSLPNASLSASKLLEPFGERRAGVTLLGVAQDFSNQLRGDRRQNAVRAGAAVIVQNWTPSLMKSPDGSSDTLSRTWLFKSGVEYAAPVLGLKETYAAFVTYRDPNSHAEITLAAGKDGLRKDYLDISIGRSFAY